MQYASETILFHSLFFIIDFLDNHCFVFVVKKIIEKKYTINLFF